jgi:hypothetical protein
MKFSKFSVLALTVLMVASCAEIPKDLFPVQQPARSLSFNGMTLTEVSESSFNLGRFRNLPRVRTMADIKSLDSAIMSYGEIQKRAARKADWETMMTARHLGMLLVEYRAYVTGSSLQSIKSIQTDTDGFAMMTVPAGGYAVLPYKLGVNPPSSSASMEKALMQLMEASLNRNAEHGDGVHVAINLQEVLKTISDVQQPVYQPSATRSSGYVSASSLPSMTNMIPMNRPFIVREPGGNRYVLERTENAWVISNPSGADMKIQIEKLGYAPEFKGYDADREAAVSLATKIEDQGISLLVDAKRKNLPGIGNCFTFKPGGFSCIGKRYHVDENGNLVANDAEKPQSKDYEKKAAYSLAMELNGDWRFKEPVFTSFKNSCERALSSSIISSKYGRSGELYTISCIDQNGNAVYSRQYYISFEKKRLVQTIGSVLEDSKKRDEIEKALAPAKMAEGFAQFVPGLGTIDSLAQCAGADSLTRDMYLRFVESASVRNQARLDSFLGEQDSIGSRTLDCLGAIAIPGKAIKAARWMSEWLSVPSKRGAELSASLKTALNSDRMKKVEAISEKFGNDWVSGKDITGIINTMRADKMGEASIKMAQTFYSAAQEGSNMVNLAGAAAGVLESGVLDGSNL